MRRRISSLDVHGQRAELDGLLAVVGGDVVVVALEPAPLEAEALAEGVELVVALIADQVGPLATAPGPDGGVDEDGHRGRFAPGCDL